MPFYLRQAGHKPLAGGFVLLVFLAGRDDSSAAQVRRTQEHSPVRQHWEPRAGRVSPGTGRKNPGPRASFAPFRGWQIGPRPRAVRPGLFSFALRDSGTLLGCGLPLCGAGVPAQCHIVFATAGSGGKLEGGPPGPRGTPSSRSRNNDISIRQTPAGRRGRRPQTRGVCPTICADVRYWENYVALGNPARSRLSAGSRPSV